MFAKNETMIRHCYRNFKPLSSRNLTNSSHGITSNFFSSVSSSQNYFDYDRDSGIVSYATSNQNGAVPNDKNFIPIFQTVIGLEIHAQLSISSKLFSRSPTKHTQFPFHENISKSKPNTLISPYDLAYPGNLPQLPSLDAIQSTIRTCAALQCKTISECSRFERKHYFYADLPHGYQITQQRWPIGKDGCLDLEYDLDMLQDLEQKSKKHKKKTSHINTGKTDTKLLRIGIERIQLEQDSGKTISTNERSPSNDPSPSQLNLSKIDLNRAGCALMEIVFRPDIRSAHQAAMAVTKLQSILKYIKYVMKYIWFFFYIRKLKQSYILFAFFLQYNAIQCNL